MGDDYYNPITAQTYVKPVPLWKPLLAFAAGVAALIGCAWFLVERVFSLQRIF